MDILEDAGGPDTAEKWTRDALSRKERIMGFGHRVYKTGDVRAGILKVYARKMAEQIGETKWEDTADLIERVMAAEKNMYPNLDWPAGRLYHAMKLEIPLYTPIFAMSRISGWAAPRHRAARQQPSHPPPRPLQGPAAAKGEAHRRTGLKTNPPRPNSAGAASITEGGFRRGPRPAPARLRATSGTYPLACSACGTSPGCPTSPP